MIAIIVALGWSVVTIIVVIVVVRAGAGILVMQVINVKRTLIHAAMLTAVILDPQVLSFVLQIVARVIAGVNWGIIPRNLPVRIVGSVREGRVLSGKLSWVRYVMGAGAIRSVEQVRAHPIRVVEHVIPSP